MTRQNVLGIEVAVEVNQNRRSPESSYDPIALITAIYGLRRCITDCSFEYRKRTIISSIDFCVCISLPISVAYAYIYTYIIFSLRLFYFYVEIFFGNGMRRGLLLLIGT